MNEYLKMTVDENNGGGTREEYEREPSNHEKAVCKGHETNIEPEKRFMK